MYYASKHKSKNDVHRLHKRLPYKFKLSRKLTPNKNPGKSGIGLNLCEASRQLLNRLEEYLQRLIIFDTDN
jgi:hypothetical protein